MENLKNALENANNANNKIREEAISFLCQIINDISPEFLYFSPAILEDESLNYSIRREDALCISRFFAPERNRINTLKKFFQDPEKMDLLEKLETSVFTVLHKDTSLIRSECLHIMSLLIPLRGEAIVEKIKTIFSYFSLEEDEGVTVSVVMLNEILSNPFVGTFADIPEMRELIISAHESIFQIIAQEFDGSDSKVELKQKAADALLTSMTSIPFLTSEEAPVSKILQALPYSFPISNIALFTTLNQIMFKVCINNYANRENFGPIILEYVKKSFSITDKNYIDTVMTFLDELTEFETNIPINEDEEYLSVRFIDDLFPFFIQCISFGYENMESSLYHYAYDVMKKIFNLNIPKIAQLLFAQVDNKIKETDTMTTFIIITLLAIFGELRESATSEDVSRIQDYILDKVGYIASCISESGDPMLMKNGLWCLSRIFSRFKDIVRYNIDFDQYISIVNITEVDDPILFYFYVEMIGSICEAFKPSDIKNPFYGERFASVSQLIMLLFQFPPIGENNKYILNLEKTIKIFIMHASNDSFTIMRDLFYSLIDQLDESASDVRDLTVIQSLTCFTILQIEKVCKNTNIDYQKAIPVLSKIIRMQNVMIYNSAMPAFTVAVTNNSFSPEYFEELVNLVEIGFQSDDPSVIKCAAKMANIACSEFLKDVAPWIPKLFEMMNSILRSANVFCKDLAIPWLIRAVATLFSANLGNEFIKGKKPISNTEYKELYGEFYYGNKELFLELIYHFGTEIPYSSEYEDVHEYCTELIGAVCTAMAEYIYQFPYEEDDKKSEAIFFRKYYVPFIRNIMNLKELSDNCIKDFFYMLDNLNCFVTKYNHGRILHRNTIAILNRIEISGKFPEEIAIIKEKFSIDNFSI